MSDTTLKSNHPDLFEALVQVIQAYQEASRISVRQHQNTETFLRRATDAINAARAKQDVFEALLCAALPREPLARPRGEARPFSAWSVIRRAMLDAITAHTSEMQYEVYSAKLDDIARQADDTITAHYDATPAARGEAVAWALLRDGVRVADLPPTFKLPTDAADVERAWSAKFVPLYTHPPRADVPCARCAELEQEVRDVTGDCERAQASEYEYEQAINRALEPFGVRFMDPPDGGSVTLGEQIERMSAALVEAESRADAPEVTVTEAQWDARLWRDSLKGLTIVVSDPYEGRVVLQYDSEESAGLTAADYQNALDSLPKRAS